MPKPVPGAVTYGVIPRDIHGEPVWNAIPPLADKGNRAPAS